MVQHVRFFLFFFFVAERLLGRHLRLFTWDHCEGLEEVGRPWSYAINAVTPISRPVNQISQIGDI